MIPEKQRGGLLLTVLVSGVVGVGVVTGSLLLLRTPGELPGGVPVEATAELGRQLLRETSVLMGPRQQNPALRFTGSNLDCASCHLDTGTKPGTLTLLTAAAKYPRFSGRDGVEGDLLDRINGCMVRSMNGRELPRDSVQLNAMATYVEELGRQYAVMGNGRKDPREPEPFVEPARAADIAAGEQVYQKRCQVCHGSNGEGLPATLDLQEGYLFPPLWGPDSFNNGAGMNRLLTAAPFIKARMPLGQPDLSSDEAYDVAAFVNSHPRPQMANLEADYPDRTTKPVDGPYPPYADSFPIEQHRIGPFGPIRDYYKTLK